MKKLLLVACLVVGLGISGKSIEARGGIGLALGNPAGITMRLNAPIVFTLGYAWWSGGLYGSVDYWFLNPKIQASGANLSWYLGAGVFTGFGFYSLLYTSGFVLGARVPFGLQYFPTKDIELYVELAPAVRFLSNIAFDWQASLGIRFLIF